MSGATIVVSCASVLLGALFGLSVASGMAADAPAAYALRWVSNSASPGQWSLQVTGPNAKTLDALRGADWSLAQWQKLLVVHAEQGDALGTVGMPAVLGNYRIVTNAIHFEPQFPLEPGIKYVAAFFPSRLPEGDGGGKFVSSVFELPREVLKPSTVVKEVYPSADVLPENLLKFYVHFSAPMSRGHIYDHIHLRDDAGKDVELPFLEIDEELWNPDLTRLTLFIDPGRIKRGVQPLEEIGPALVEGRQYSLVIDPAWKDGRGVALKAGYQKSFRIGPPDRDAVQPNRWKLQLPKAATREPLTIEFGESLDHALAQRMIHVTDKSAGAVDGKVVMADHEHRWSFTPAQPWTRGTHTLLVQNTIEDTAGNNIGKSFEVDLFEGVQRRFTNTTVKLPFEVK